MRKIRPPFYRSINKAINNGTSHLLSTSTNFALMPGGRHLGSNRMKNLLGLPLKLVRSQNNAFLLKENSCTESLPVVESFMKHFIGEFGINRLEKTGVVYIHHPLKTSVNVVDAMIRLGVEPGNIFVLGKSYSECPEVVREIRDLGVFYQSCSSQKVMGKFSMTFVYDVLRLWSSLIANIKDDVEEIIIMDHGGHALTLTPPEVLAKYKIVGIEKTTAGLIKMEDEGMPPFPVINVAGCSAKKILESPLIAEAVVNKLTPLLSQKPIKTVPGVVGYGAIGKAIVQKLLSMGHSKVLVYDSDHKKIASDQVGKKVITTNELSALLAASDYIFGCTGRDITEAKEFFRLSVSNKTLISCSSEDKEFHTLLEVIRLSGQQNLMTPFDNIFFSTDMGATIHIIKGGFPVNFDHTGESVPRNDIQLTRALVVAAFYQAIGILRDQALLNQSKMIPLDPLKQKFIAEEWIKCQPKSRISQITIQEFEKSLEEDRIALEGSYSKSFNKAGFFKKSGINTLHASDKISIPISIS